ncbi:hypothetical protein E2C01_039802 [Portunus trituberculatus]|uniref:Uncharacterized protein n=1 Tax=Portunus trituberculatus TaxID=210409 RepID=A0A5B7FLQ8_PORTR|nr:hypothetical protein [Portunus trituberculatus]
MREDEAEEEGRALRRDVTLQVLVAHRLYEPSIAALVSIALMLMGAVLAANLVTTNAAPSLYRGRSGTVEPCVLWGPSGLQAHGFEFYPRSTCRLGFLTRGNGFLSGELSDRRYPKKYPL